MAIENQSHTLHAVLGDKNKRFSRLSSVSPPTTPNHVCKEEHGHENERGHLQRSTLALVLHHGFSGALMRSVRQIDTLLGVLGDKNKLFPRLSSGTFRINTTHVLARDHGHYNERGAREAVSACLRFDHGHERQLSRAGRVGSRSQLVELGAATCVGTCLGHV